MKISKNKTMASLIALSLTLTIALTFVTLPTVNAAVTFYHSLVYVATSRDVIGVNQPLLLVMWTADIPPDIGEQAGTIGGRAGWDNIIMTVTLPDNTTQDLTLKRSDPVGGGYLQYIPPVVGTYYVQAFFPETWKNTTANQAHYTAGKSIKVAFTVQQAPIQPWPESPLPNDYWTRPISGAARDWYVLTGNRLGGAANVWPMGSSGGNTGSFSYGQAPESAHILWSKPFYIGGLADERFGGINYQTSHYQGVTWSSSIILNGKVYYSPRMTAHGNQGLAILDLYTGETLFKDYNATGPAFGQIYEYETGNQHGTFAYLYQTSGVTLPQIVQVPHVQQDATFNVIRTAASTTINRTATPYAINVTGTLWAMLDGWTGATICYIANVSTTGTNVYGKDGSILYYNAVNLQTNASLPANYYLTVWNASWGTMPSSQTGTGAWQWRPAGGTFGGANAYLGTLAYNYVHDGNVFWDLNVSIPSLLGTRNALLNETAAIRAVRQDKYVIFGTAGRNDERGVVPGWNIAVSLEPGKQGRVMWQSTLTPPMASQALNQTVSFTGLYPEDGVILYESADMLKRWGFNMTTGALLWEGEPEIQMNYYGMSDSYYQGKLLTYGSLAGTELRAYNITTGKIVWTYNPAPVGDESPYGNYPLSIGTIADGKLYTYTSEHSYTHPLYRGPNLRCINASDGKEIWSILDFGGGLAIADGVLLSSNSMDNMIYAYGKGPSATTVSATQNVPALGSSVTITGTVTDQTPSGRRNTNDLVDFTLKGTPAISDEDMSAWMEYKFMQQAYPANAKGVDVTLDAIDPNGNFIHIGTTTSDINGNYGYAFTPEVPGTYQIIATFAGSKAYGPSSTTTYMTVGEAPPTPAEPQPAPAQPPLDMYLLYATIAIIIAIAIVGLMILRKKP
jgi:hypothetical protein